MKVSDNFDVIVESLIKRFYEKEIDEIELHSTLRKVYEDVENELINDITTLMTEGVITRDEAYQYASYMDNGYPCEEKDIYDMVDDTLYSMDEYAALEADKNVVKGKITDSERERLLKEYQKREKKAKFKNKLKKVAKGVGTAALLAGAVYGGYKGGKAIGKSADEGGALNYHARNLKNKVEEYKDKKEDKKYSKLLYNNMRRENPLYKDYYDKYDKDNEEINREEQRRLSTARNDYEKDKIRDESNQKRAKSRQWLDETNDAVMDHKYGYRNIERKEVEPVYDKNGKIDKRATKLKQNEEDRKYRESKKKLRDKVTEQEAKKAAKYAEIDAYKQAEIQRALTPLHKKVIKGLYDAPMNIANKIDNAVAGMQHNTIKKINAKYKNSYK
jgi:hypothetical protein